MMSFKIKLSKGEMYFNDFFFEEGYKVETGFIMSSFYRELIKNNQIKKIMPHHYLLKNMVWKGKVFEIVIRTKFSDTFPFMVQLVDQDGEYYNSLNNWDERTDISMLEREVKGLYSWLIDECDFPDDVEYIDNGVRWLCKWGRISVSYETKSFNSGIYITYY